MTSKIVLSIGFGLCIGARGDIGLFASDVLEDDFFRTHTHAHTHTKHKMTNKALKPTATDTPSWGQPLSGPVQPVCPSGFDLLDTMCVKQIVADPVVSCPYGAFRNREGVCVSVDSVPPEKSCPFGYEWYLKGCVRKHVAPPSTACEHGFSVVEDMCVSRRNLSPQLVCPSGYDHTHTHDSHAHTHTQDGHIHTHTQDAHTHINADTCAKSYEYEAMQMCPDGFQLKEDNLCEREVESRQVACAEGHVLEYSPENTPVCVQHVLVSGRPVCASNMHLNPSETLCVGRRVTPPRYECLEHGPRHEAKRRNSLLKHISSEKKSHVECSDEFLESVCRTGTQVDNMCVEELTHTPEYVFESLDVSPVMQSRINSECTQSIINNSHVSSDGYNDIHTVNTHTHTAHAHTQHKQHTHTQYSDNSDGVESDHAYVSYAENGAPVCEYVSVKTANNICIHDHKRKTNIGCSTVEAVPSQYMCKDSDTVTPSGRCVHTEYTQGEWVCPDGETPSPSGRCPSLLTAAMITVCPDGYRDGYFEGTKTGMCEKVQYANVQEVCPVGYDRDPKHIKDNNKACVAEKITRPIAMCEPGFFEEGDKCVKTVKVAPSLMTVDGELSACRPSVSGGGPSCGLEMKYYAELTNKGKKKGDKRKKRLMIDRLI